MKPNRLALGGFLLAFAAGVALTVTYYEMNETPGEPKPLPAPAPKEMGATERSIAHGRRTLSMDSNDLERPSAKSQSATTSLPRSLPPKSRERSTQDQDAIAARAKLRDQAIRAYQTSVAESASENLLRSQLGHIQTVSSCDEMLRFMLDAARESTTLSEQAALGRHLASMWEAYSDRPEVRGIPLRESSGNEAIRRVTLLAGTIRGGNSSEWWQLLEQEILEGSNEALAISLLKQARQSPPSSALASLLSRVLAQAGTEETRGAALEATRSVLIADRNSRQLIRSGIQAKTPPLSSEARRALIDSLIEIAIARQQAKGTTWKAIEALIVSDPASLQAVVDLGPFSEAEQRQILQMMTEHLRD